MTDAPAPKHRLPTRADWPSVFGDRAGYLGTAEVASALGVTRQRVGQIRRDDPTFPGRHTELDGGPIWIRAGFEVWATLHRPNAVSRPSVFEPHGTRLLRTAEALATSMRYGYVGAPHLWLALLTDEEVGVRAAFASMGASPAVVRRIVGRFEPPWEEAKRGAAMNSRAQMHFRAGAAAARDRGADVMEPLDLAIGIVDAADPVQGRGRPDLVIGVLEGRGVDVAELRTRLAAIRSDPNAALTLERRELRRHPRRVNPYRRILGPLAPNGLGHDPWTRQPWGTAFAHRRDDRMLRIDGEQWFFTIDRDGFFVRTADGRPVGYRWRIEPTPAPEPVNGSLEILPMPPDDVGYWPDNRYRRD